MCRRLSSSMVVRYALGGRKSISYCELLDIRKRLMHVGAGYLVDMSFRSVSQAVRAYDNDLEIIIEHETYSIRRRGNAKTTRMLDYKHLKKCYMSFVPAVDCRSIVSILSGKTKRHGRKS